MPKKKLHAILLIFLIVSKDYNFSCTGQISFWKTKPSFNPSFQNAAHSWSKSRVCINSSAQNNSEVMKPMARKPHKLVDYKGWQFLSLVGVVGTCSNLLVLHFFYSEPNMATSVNAMIFMETIYRVGYTLTIQWRTFNFVHEHTLLSYWFTREKVSKCITRLLKLT